MTAGARDDSTDGPSQRPNRQFWDALFGEGLDQLGVMNADSHEDVLWGISEAYIRWVIYETNLFGDPAAKMVRWIWRSPTARPPTGSIVATPPTDFDVTFSEPYPALRAFDAGDLLVNGIAADSLHADRRPEHVTFHYATSPVTTQGPQTMSIAAGAILRASRQRARCRPGGRRSDMTRMSMAVASTSPANGAIVDHARSTTSRSISTRPMTPDSIGTDDLTLSQGTVVSASMVDADTVGYTLAGVDARGRLDGRSGRRRGHGRLGQPRSRVLGQLQRSKSARSRSRRL